jgi:hypothetical protein
MTPYPDVVQARIMRFPTENAITPHNRSTDNGLKNSPAEEKSDE